MRLFLFLFVFLSPAFARALDTAPLESIPVQEGGRKKPYLVFADESLLSLSGRTDLTIDGKSRPASDIITSLWLAPDGWEKQPLILINNRPLKEALKFDPQRKFFSYDELANNAAFAALLQKARAAKEAVKDGKLQGQDKQVEEVGMRLAEFEQLRKGDLFRVVANPAGAEAAWFTLRPDDPTFAAMREAWKANDDAAFATAARNLAAALAAQAPQYQPPAWKIGLENLYQKTHPFRWAWILYLSAGVCLVVTSLRARGAGYALGWVLAASGLLFQIFGFVCRIVIAGRPPVSNMYESVIWVSFGAMLFALIFEAIYRGRFFLLGACFATIVPLLLADTQPLALNRSIQPLVPVLQSNFWLSTHVLVITLSYAAFLLALGVAHIALGKIIIGRKPGAAIYNYVYRALQVGVLLLAIGTVLGAVWANYSWGRFWDWDPKETWALVALLIYLFILHGRIAGAWGGFGLALGSVLGFLSIVMAWYGVNFVLGVGMHSYGFGTGGFGYAIAYVIAELAFAGIAVARHRAKKLAAPATRLPLEPATDRHG